MKLHPLGTSTSEARYACRRSAILLLLNCPQALVQVVARLPKKAKINVLLKFVFTQENVANHTFVGF